MNRITTNAHKAGRPEMKLEARKGKADWGQAGWLVGWAFTAPDGIEDFWTVLFVENQADLKSVMTRMIDNGQAERTATDITL